MKQLVEQVLGQKLSEEMQNSLSHQNTGDGAGGNAPRSTLQHKDSADQSPPKSSVPFIENPKIFLPLHKIILVGKDLLAHHV